MAQAPQKANAAEIESWNGPTGDRWLKQYDVIGPQLGPLGRRVMDHLGISSGERVLDVGCGTGDTTFELASRVGAGGSVLGVDVSQPLLDRARDRAAAKPSNQIAFVQADAQTDGFEQAAFDALYSRFGVMFFEDPGAALANLRAALRPGGRLAFVCWRSPRENPFMTLPTRAALPFMDAPPQTDPTAPGPFAFADAERLRGLLTGAGFEDIAIAPFDDTIVGQREDVRATMERRDPLKGLLAAADPGRRAKIAAALDEALEPFIRDGTVALPAATWLVSARNP